MKIAFILYTLLMTTSPAATEFSLLHYNIRELDSKKIKNRDHQMEQVRKVISAKNFDILSLNEIQYDFPGVPNDSYQSQGQNLKELKKLLNLPQIWNETFYPANTGARAQKNAQGEYERDPNLPGARELADQINFGTFPGQYSTGALYKFKKIKEVQINKLTWKEFNPKINLQEFAMENGDPLPENTELFDKNFTDVTLNIQGRPVHLILFHAVPSHHFGNVKSPNYARNQDQLRFLEWYLTGKTDIDTRLGEIKNIAGESFVAVGDFNADITQGQDPGAQVLKNLFSKANLWMKQADLSFSNEGGSYAPWTTRLMLDYMLTSSDIKVLAGEIMHPSFKRVELGCNDNVQTGAMPGMVLKTYQDYEKNCNVLISEQYERYKEASDHYPIWGRFQIK